MDLPVNLPVELRKWEYATPGPLRERLSGLTLAGAKTTTFGLPALSEAFGEALEEVGQRWVMVGTNGAELAVIEIMAVEELRLADVRWEQADAEGESFRSVADWRSAHERFWEPFVPEVRAHLDDPTWTISDDTIVACITVRVAERLAGHDQARYPVVECVVDPIDVDVVVDALHQLDTTGIEELDADGEIRRTSGSVVPAGAVLLRAGFASDEAAVAAEAALDRQWQPRYEVLLGDLWLDAWREHFETQRVGRVVIVPDWKDASDPIVSDDDVVVRLDPARSFGTGAHPSTRLVLQALQALDLQGRTVVDVGCGSGVLSVAALLLGAESAHGTDVEAAALDATLDNARRNGVASRCSVSRAGDRGGDGQRADGRRAEVVVANILAPVLIGEAPSIAQYVAGGAVLVLAGLIEEQRDRVVAAYPGFTVERTWSEAPWMALQLRKPMVEGGAGC